MKKIFLLLVIILTVACGKNESKVEQNKKLKIIATNFANYDFAKEIVGDMAEVKLLLNPGVEAHSYNPTPKDIIDIKKSDLFIYTDLAMEPWVEKIINSSKKDEDSIVKTSTNIDLIILDEEHHHENEKDEHHDNHNHNHEKKNQDKHVHDDNCDHGGVDPHIWLDPINAKIMAKNIYDKLIIIDSVNIEVYRKNLENYNIKLDNLDKKISDSLNNFNNRDIIYSGHMAFGYFSKRYKVNFTTPYLSLSPNSEATPRQLARMIQKIKKKKIKYIYYEELLNSKTAKALKEEAKVELLLLHGAHNISKSDLENGLSYIEIMNNNLKHLEIGLKNE